MSDQKLNTPTLPPPSSEPSLMCDLLNLTRKHVNSGSSPAIAAHSAMQELNIPNEEHVAIELAARVRKNE